ncbi:MAG: hypothetical protein SVM79_07485 [Chloroflexota bacterium]|nr:hypothetical protein [Chloroflexota bacterium]
MNYSIDMALSVGHGAAGNGGGRGRGVPGSGVRCAGPPPRRSRGARSRLGLAMSHRLSELFNKHCVLGSSYRGGQWPRAGTVRTDGGSV